MRREGFRYLVRILAGGYVIYLAIQIIKDGLIGGGMQGNSRIIGWIFSIFFIAAGAFLCYIGVKGLFGAA